MPRVPPLFINPYPINEETYSILQVSPPFIGPGPVIPSVDQWEPIHLSVDWTSSSFIYFIPTIGEGTLFSSTDQISGYQDHPSLHLAFHETCYYQIEFRFYMVWSSRVCYPLTLTVIHNSSEVSSYTVHPTGDPEACSYMYSLLGHVMASDTLEIQIQFFNGRSVQLTERYFNVNASTIMFLP